MIIRTEKGVTITEAHLGPTFTLVELFSLIGQVSRSFKPTLRQRRWWREPTNWDCHRYLLDEKGCTDWCDARIPRYRKPG